jgi:hypothetical protein
MRLAEAHAVKELMQLAQEHAGCCNSCKFLKSCSLLEVLQLA